MVTSELQVANKYKVDNQIQKVRTNMYFPNNRIVSLVATALILLAPKHSFRAAHGWELRFGRGRNKGGVAGRKHKRGPAAALADKLHASSKGGPPPNLQIPLVPESTPPIAEDIEPTLRLLLLKLKDVLFFKPPVGAVAIAAALRLIISGRIFRFYNPVAPANSAEGVLQKQLSAEQSVSRRTRRKRRKKGRKSWDLDADDRLYETQGGVENVRRKLCWSAMTGILNPSPSVTAAVEALSTSCLPGAARENFVEDLAIHLSKLGEYLQPPKTKLLQDFNKLNVEEIRGGAREKAKIDDGDSLMLDEMLLRLSSKTAEIRALDSLLRICRDRLLATSGRIKRLERHWQRRVRIRSQLTLWWKKPFEKVVWDSLEGDRLRLAFARAAYNRESARLGRIQEILMERPSDLSDDMLLRAIKENNETEQKNRDQYALGSFQNQDNRIENAPREITSKDTWKRRLRLKASKFAWRWNVDGKLRLSLNIYDRRGDMDSKEARFVLLQNSVNDDEWINAAHEWTIRAREVLSDLITETIITEDGEPMTVSKANTTTWAEEDMKVVERWSNQNKECSNVNATAAEEEWSTVLRLVEDMTSLRRVGEGRSLYLSDLIFNDWIRRIDVLGIPSSLAAVWLAWKFHDLVIPHWADIQKGAKQAFDITWGIIDKRFWIPLCGIVADLLNKSPKLLDSFDIDIEEESLDTMLKDLGVGDGTPQGRKEALKGAATLYEDNLKTGVMGSLVRGSLIRLLLVQIQQLKAGLLKAMGSIDILVDSNRMNVQLLAAIPAFLIITFGTRIFVRFLVSLRTKDIRPTKAVHGEMTEYLNRMERCLLLAGGDETETSFDTRGKGEKVQSNTVLKPNELGEYVLHIHSYLVLLDYCSPPFPGFSCDAIQRSLQDLLSAQGKGVSIGIDRQLALLRLIKQQHKELLNSL